MDPITMAIIAALAQVSQKVIADGYEGLKSLIIKKYGEKSDLAQAVDDVEKKPDSKGRQATLQEEMANAHADKDPELLALAKSLNEQLAKLPGGQNVVTQTVTGDRNIFSGSGNVTVGETGDR